MKWFKVALGVLILACAFFAMSSRSAASSIPDTEYTRMVAEAVQRGDLYLPRVPGKFVHFRIRQVFPLATAFSFGYVDFWLGSDDLGSYQIEQDSQGVTKTKVGVHGRTVTTSNYSSAWSEEMVLDSADIASRLVEGNLWGFHQALLYKKARVVRQTSSAIVVRVPQEGSSSDQVEGTLDSKTHLPISVHQGTWPANYEYLAIEITSEGPPASVEPPPMKSIIRKMSLGEARRFTKFPLYYLGEEFAGYQLGAIQYTYQGLRFSKDINQVGFFYLPPGRTTGDAPVYVVVEPKLPEVLDDLSKRAKAGVIAADGRIGKASTGHAVTVAILDDAVVWLYGQDEVTAISMRANLRPLR